MMLTGIALLLGASSLLAADGTAQANPDTLPDSTSVSPPALTGIRGSYNIETESAIRHSPMASVFLSTILPGLGQARNGHWAKASAFVVVGSLLVTKAIVESERADRYLYLSRNAPTQSESDRYYAEYQTHFDRRDSLVWWAVGFWVYNMFDAYIDGHLFGFSRQ
jgi:hypothetical protein